MDQAEAQFNFVLQQVLALLDLDGRHKCLSNIAKENGTVFSLYIHVHDTIFMAILPFAPIESVTLLN